MISIFLVAAALLQNDSDEVKNRDVWLIRPWEIRYFIDIDFQAVFERNKIFTARENHLPGRHYFGAGEVLTITSIFAFPTASSRATRVITFEKDGRVTSPLDSPVPLYGRRSTRGYLSLLPFESKSSTLPLRFGTWFMGIYGADVNFAPAVCDSLTDMRRYEPDYDEPYYPGNVGCREWTFQLKDTGRPYIDVTSWGPEGASIGSLVGWAGFEDAPKPVIGKQGKIWVCLHECPAGEKPGVIKDIRAWTRKYHLPMPQRPKKQPMFPNADFLDAVD